MQRKAGMDQDSIDWRSRGRQTRCLISNMSVRRRSSSTPRCFWILRQPGILTICARQRRLRCHRQRNSRQYRRRSCRSHRKTGRSHCQHDSRISCSGTNASHAVAQSSYHSDDVSVTVERSRETAARSIASASCRYCDGRHLGAIW